MNDNKLSLIAEQWKTVAPRLLRFVRYRIGYSLLPKGHDAEDVLQMAFERVISGSREWNSDKVDLYTYMKCSVLRSMLSKKGLFDVKDLDTNEFDDDCADDHLSRDGVKLSDDARNVISVPDKEMAFSLLEQEIKGDEELENILAANRMGYSKPADIAEATGYDVKRVYWLQTKLSQYADKAKIKFSEMDMEVLT